MIGPIRLPLLFPRTPVAVAAAVALLAAAGPARAQDGELDPTFGNGGVVRIAWDLGGSLDDYVRDLVADGDGNLFAVGYGSSQTSDFDWEIARIDHAGGVTRLQKWFDLGGTNNDKAEAAVDDGNGGLVVAGTADHGTYNDLEVCRYFTANLQADTGFGTAFGCEDYNLGAGEVFDVAAVLRAGDGGFIVAGTINQSGNQDFFAIRYTASGHVDGNFGFFGIRVVAWDLVANGFDAMTSATVDFNGEILLGGRAQGGGNDSYGALAKLTAAGNLDGAFGTGGKVLFNSPIQQARASALEADLRGAGTSFVLAAYVANADGSSAALTNTVSPSGLVPIYWSDATWDAAAVNHAPRLRFQSNGLALVTGDNLSANGAIFRASRFYCLDAACPRDTFWGNQGTATFSPFDSGYGVGGTLTGAALTGGRLALAGDSLQSNHNWLILRLTSTLIFRDGFETGDTRMWPIR
jgi:uncharacterized delta-60 repeat protein